MPGPPPAVAAVRLAVRELLTRLGPGTRVLVACSGGADSLALAAATAFEAPRAGVLAGAAIVDHQLQAGSDQVAARAAGQCRELGLEPVGVLTVTVTDTGGGREDAARVARYAALRALAADHGAAAILLGHTRDDQAEQVLLGLARGSGARSLSGIPPADELLARPLLGITRAQAQDACRAAGLTWWSDPHNEDPSYARVRARGLIAQAEQLLGPGFGAALARSAALLRDDADLLDELARAARDRLPTVAQPPGQLRVEAAALSGIPDPLRRRVWRLLAAQAGAGALSATHVGALDALVTRWHGQGPVDLPGAVQATRRDGWISLVTVLDRV